MKTIQELEKERLEWSLKTFTEATPYSSLQKLKGEINEVEKELEIMFSGNAIDMSASISRTAEEYADCLMCLFDSAGRAGIPVELIFEKFDFKLIKNKNRSWLKNADNTYSHIKP